MALWNFILSLMRYAPVWLVLGLLGVIASIGCFFGGGPATEPPEVDLQATIDAALARVAAAPETAPAPTATSLPATAAPTERPTIAPPSPVPSATPIPRQPPTATPGPPAYQLSEVLNWDYARQSAPSVTVRVASLDWVADGLQDKYEFNAVERLVNIGIDNSEVLDTLLEAHLQGRRPEPLDLPALLSLERMAHNTPKHLERLHGADWFRDGWTDAETAIVAILFDRSLFPSPEFDAILADPSTLNVEIGTTLNLAGESVPIAIARSGPAPTTSPVMAVAQSAVPLFEEMFAAPFPTPAIVIHMTDYVIGAAGGSNDQTHVTLLTEIDQGAEPGYDTHLIYHEIAHYYLYAEPTWYAEGGADFAASYVLRNTTGSALEPINYPCGSAGNLKELELRSPDDPREAQNDADLYGCNYFLGERLLMALYRQLGEERFLQAWRALYARLERDPSYPSQYEFTETDIRVEWLRAGGMQMQPDLEHIWDQWYRGRASTVVEGVPDPAPADPTLPTVNGRVDQAYIALSVDGNPIHEFSASDVAGWVYLTLEYSYSIAGDPRQLNFEVVEHFQDGFTNGRHRVPVQFESQFAGGAQWLSVGPSPPRRWGPGRYWVYVYESGRKVAEVQFDVTP